jgi:hypothetical protein
MILVMAGRQTARALRRVRGGAARPGNDGAVSVLDPAGLSVPGWTYDPADPDSGRIVIDGQAGPAAALTAVITALDAVAPGDVPHVRIADRAFVAAEMTAFLRGWLATLTCPVVDPPTTLALSGPGAERAEWSAAAAAAGVAQRLAVPVPGRPVRTVTVVAGQVVGPQPPPATACTARAVTLAAEVTGARLTFTDDAGMLVLCRAVPWWHAPDRLAFDALLAHARKRAGATARPAP